MKTLGVVPARMGSKGIAGKNKRDFCGKPLVCWAIEIGQKTCDRVEVTSDDPEILSIAQNYGIDGIVRPPGLADDHTPMLDVLKHVLACQEDEPDALVLLQPTAPLRRVGHVKQALWTMTLTQNCDSVVSVVQIPSHLSPDFAMVMRNGWMEWLFPLRRPSRRQDCRTMYYRDGTVYVIKPRIIRQGSLYGLCMPLCIPPDQSCTLDDESDWVKAEEMWRSTNG